MANLNLIGISLLPIWGSRPWSVSVSHIVVVVSTDLEYLNACSEFFKITLSLSLESQWLIALSESGIGRNEI